MAVMAEANRELVGPAFLTALRRRGLEGDLARDVHDYLALLLDYNSARNARIRAQCIAIGGLFEAAGITAVLLKGAAWLFDDHSDAAADRIMHDIDLLLPAERLDDAAQLLTGAAYREDADFSEIGHFHLASLIPERGEAAVELHRDVSRWPARLRATEVIRDACAIAPGLAMPSAAHRILHNVLHAQLENGYWLSGIVSLRDTLDLARLVEMRGQAVDWVALSEEARVRKNRAPLSGALHVAARFLGSSVPAPFRDDRSGRQHAARCAVGERYVHVGRAFQVLDRAHRAFDWKRDAYGLEATDCQGLRLRIAVLRRWFSRLGRSRWLSLRRKEPVRWGRMVRRAGLSQLDPVPNRARLAEPASEASCKSCSESPNDGRGRAIPHKANGAFQRKMDGEP